MDTTRFDRPDIYMLTWTVSHNCISKCVIEKHTDCSSSSHKKICCELIGPENSITQTMLNEKTAYLINLPQHYTFHVCSIVHLFHSHLQIIHWFSCSALQVTIGAKVDQCNSLSNWVSRHLCTIRVPVHYCWGLF